uniref:Uncharacterized protein n=1 Tax=Glossina pallidipes TaxID=7398 RepID=A0A1A9ZUA2_GLOPL
MVSVVMDTSFHFIAPCISASIQPPIIAHFMYFSSDDDDRHLRHQVLKRETKVQSEATVRSKLPYYRDAERECDRLKRLYGNRDEKYSDLRRSRKEDFRKQKPRESFSKRANDRNGHRSRRTDRGKRNYKPKREKSPHRQTASVARKSPQSSMETKIVYVPLPILTCPYPYWRPNFYDGYFRSNWTRPNQNFHRETFYHNKINSRMQ